MRLEDSVRQLSFIGFQCQRVIDFAAASLIQSTSLTDKVSLARTMGVIARALPLLETRQNELEIKIHFEAPSAYEAELFNTSRAIGWPLVQEMTKGLMDSVQTYKAQILLPEDEPSYLVAAQIETLLLQLPHAPHAPRFSFSDDVVRYEDVKSQLPGYRGVPGRPIVVKRTGKSFPLDANQKFYHFLTVEIEIAAMEVCSRSLLDGNIQMPLQFKLDLAKQIWDEARHAQLAEAKLKEFGGQIGDLPYYGFSWNNYIKGESLAERLAIQHIVQEGNGFEDSLDIIKKLESNEDPFEKTWKYISVDEREHVRIGNRWVMHLCEQDPQRYAEVLQSALRRLNTSMPREGKSLNLQARRQCEFPETFLASILG